MITAVKLQDLKTGDRACVLSICGNERDLARLTALGVRGGVRLELLSEGAPCIIQLGESRLCLRPSNQLQIMVQPEN